jgi:phosphotriesterase-related protein
VLFHEHMQFGWPGFGLDFRARRTDPERAVRVLDELADLGYGALVDATPMECGQDLDLLAGIARQSRLQVVGATGIYHAQRGFPDHLASLTADEIAELFRHDLCGGPGRGRAGVSMVAGETAEPAQRERKALVAAGTVSANDDVPILTHTGSAAVARMQFEVLTGAGANPARIVLGHLDNPGNTFDEVAALAGLGAFIGIDRFGGGGDTVDERRAGLVTALVAAGLVRSIMISHDRPLTFLGRVTTGHETGNPFTHIEQNAVPLLKARGLSDSDIATILEDNPRRWLQ